MLQLPSKALTASTSQHLLDEKQKIVAKANFREKVEESKRLWKGKRSGTGANAFREIKDLLDAMCPAPGICCYCENNEGTDIEHVVPQRVFPEMTFDWENYLLVCTKCNSTFKISKSSVFSPAGSVLALDITPKRKVYTVPPTNDSLFINPRTEDPQQYLTLELLPQTFLLQPIATDVNSRSYQRAVYTRETISLNRAKLLEAREAAARDCVALFSAYDAVHHANNFDELEAATKGIPAADRTKNISAEKDRIKSKISQQISRKSHPTVWAEIKRHRASLPHMSPLFQQYPEALIW